MINAFELVLIRIMSQAFYFSFALSSVL